MLFTKMKVNECMLSSLSKIIFGVFEYAQHWAPTQYRTKTNKTKTKQKTKNATQKTKMTSNTYSKTNDEQRVLKNPKNYFTET
jgi:hypothetical protein